MTNTRPSVSAAAWLEALHRRVCDRIQHQQTRELAAAHCRLELYLPNGWPALRLAGELPVGRGWPDAVCTRYREALQAVLREMASKEALETAVREASDQISIFTGEAR